MRTPSAQLQYLVELMKQEVHAILRKTTVEHQKAVGVKEVAKAPKQINKVIQSPETGATRSWGRMAFTSAIAST